MGGSQKLRRLCAVLLSVMILAIGLGLPLRVDAAEDYSEYPLTKNNLLSGKIIILDPGHSDTSGPAYGSYVEGLHNRLVAEALRRNLENCGATVYMTREGPADVPNCVRMAYVNKVALEHLLSVKLAERAALTNGSPEAQQADEKLKEIRRVIAVMQSVLNNHSLQTTYFNTPYDYNRTRKIHPDLLSAFELENDPAVYPNMQMISLHTNAPGGNPPNTGTNGATAYRLTNSHWETANYFANYCNVERNQRLAQTLLRHACAATGFKNNGIVVNDLFMIRETNIPVTLLENGYHTNEHDRAILTSAEGRQKLTTGIALGVLEYFGKTYDRSAILAETYGYSAGSGSQNATYVSAAAAGLTGAQFLGKLSAKEGVTLAVADEAGAEKAADATMKTGDRLIVTDAKGTKTYIVAVRGDLNRDGRVALADLLMVQKYMLGTLTLDGAQKEAGDINRDGKNSLADLLLIQKHLLGTQLIQ